MIRDSFRPQHLRSITVRKGNSALLHCGVPVAMLNESWKASDSPFKIGCSFSSQLSR